MVLHVRCLYLNIAVATLVQALVMVQLAQIQSILLIIMLNRLVSSIHSSADVLIEQH